MYNQEEAMTMVGRIAILNDGQLQQIGVPRGGIHQPASTVVTQFIGSPNINLFNGPIEPTEDGYLISDVVVNVTLPAELLAAELKASPPHSESDVRTKPSSLRTPNSTRRLPVQRRS